MAKPLLQFKDLPLIDQRIQNIENAKAIKVNVNNALKKISANFVTNLKQIIPKLPNIELKQIFISALAKAQQFDKDIQEGEATFTEFEKNCQTVVNQFKKYFSQ